MNCISSQLSINEYLVLNNDIQDLFCSIDISTFVEIEQFLVGFPSFTDNYLPINRIGEGSNIRISYLGTFSTVYRALDLNYHKYKNEVSLQQIEPPSKDELAVLELYANYPEKFAHVTDVSPESTAIWRSLFRKAMAFYRENDFNPVFVAVKRINPTSSPDRILDEISHIADVSRHENIVSIISVQRHEDQIAVITPYFQHLDFREYYQSMDIAQVQSYLRSILSATKRVHECSIIHRDLKPSNFLYSPKLRKGLLVDFGLAQKYTPSTEPQSSSPNNANQQPHHHHHHRKPGFYLNDKRPSFKASRAGTRGFRAPEVLFKCANQTPLIDIWSIGVILLTILVGHYPLFNSADDFDAIIEIACIFGNKAMAEAAQFYNREWKCNIPSVPLERIPFQKLVEHFNPKIFKSLPIDAFDLLERLLALKSNERITAEEALRHPFLM